MAVVTGALGSLAPKLLQLLQDEYKLQKNIRAEVQSLSRELEAMHTALWKVALVPHDQLDPQVKLWASEVREASYDMEDIIDSFLVRVDGGHPPTDADKNKLERLTEKMGKLFSLSKLKARRDIAGAIEDIKNQVDDMTKRRESHRYSVLALLNFAYEQAGKSDEIFRMFFLHKRYMVDVHLANSTAITTIDPRLLSLQTKASDLVGIDEPMDMLIRSLTLEDDLASNKNLKIVSVVGSGGLGKTTLTKVVYEKLTVDMDIHCKAFIPVGRNPHLKKVFRDILLALDMESYSNRTNFEILDERQLIEEIQDFLKEKRYFIVIDDVWDVPSWNAIRTALEDNNLGSKIIITTRSSDVARAKQVHYSYKLKPLPSQRSEHLFYGRIFGSKNKCPETFIELSERFLKKCGGVPLAIMTISSMLADKLEDVAEWEVLCNAIGTGLSSAADDLDNMRRILLLSYYDLPPNMKTCFLYLSIYPEDYEIERDRLIWMWISEGFVQSEKKGDDLFELGKSYFSDLINRSLVHPVGDMDNSKEIYRCRVHDMILDLILALSREQNFVTTTDDMEQVLSSKSRKTRRLNLQNTITWPKKGLSQVRSIFGILSPYSIPSFSSSNVLRVLDLEKFHQLFSKLDVGNLIHLRYLWLSGEFLPEILGIEKLQFLQVMNISNRLPPVSLPIYGLGRLMYLDGVLCHPKSGNQLRNLTCLQVLRTLDVGEDSVGIVKELGHLTQLKELEIEFNLKMDQSTCEALINSLGNLSKLEHLEIEHGLSTRNNLIKWELWTPPPHLRVLFVREDYSLQMLHKWISPASLPRLNVLILSVVHSIAPEDIQIIGTLPNLSYLILRADREVLFFDERPLQKFVVSANAFPHATFCFFFYVVIVPSMFPQGAMPRLEHVRFCLRARDFFSNRVFDFDDLAMEHLPSLRRVIFSIDWDDISKEEETKLKEELKHAGDVHPNHPSIDWEDMN